MSDQRRYVRNSISCVASVSSLATGIWLDNSVEHCTGIAEVMGLIGSSLNYFLGNCAGLSFINYFIHSSKYRVLISDISCSQCVLMIIVISILI